MTGMTRRGLLAAGAAALAAPRAVAAGVGEFRVIPSTGERIPAVGLGSWITFNVGDDQKLIDASAAVIRAFAEAGGGMIDSSPMYGSSQDTIGYGLARLESGAPVFAADKVWTSSPGEGRGQIAQSLTEWGVARFDLLQVHNLVATEAHLETLFAMKQAGDLRFVGVTTSHGRRHREMERAMTRWPLDFVQLTYNIADREAEERLLPLARERGVAVIANRPYRRGALVRRLKGSPLPPWAGELGAASWAQLLLKFVISHPAITVAIPATTRVDHVLENKAAALGPALDAATRGRMAAYVRDL